MPDPCPSKVLLWRSLVFLWETCTVVGNSLPAINSPFQDLSPYMYTNHSTPMQLQDCNYANTPTHQNRLCMRCEVLQGLLHWLLSSSLMVCPEDINAIRRQLGLSVIVCAFIFWSAEIIYISLLQYIENISIWIYVSCDDNSILVTRICHERKSVKFFVSSLQLDNWPTMFWKIQILASWKKFNLESMEHFHFHLIS